MNVPSRPRRADRPLAFLDVDYQASLDDCIRELWPHLTDHGYVFIDELAPTT